MANNVNIFLNSILQGLDNTVIPPITVVQSSMGSPTLAGTVYFYDAFLQAAGGGGTTVTLPAATVWVVYVRNRDVAVNLTVTFTPSGGGAQTCVLVPNGIFLYFQPTEGAGGITALSVTSGAGPTPAEVLVAK